MVDAQNTWDAHPINVQIKELGRVVKNYEPLVIGERGPVVAIHGNTVATQFGIDRQYPETVQILRNFIEQVYN